MGSLVAGCAPCESIELAQPLPACELEAGVRAHLAWHEAAIAELQRALGIVMDPSGPPWKGVER